MLFKKYVGFADDAMYSIVDNICPHGHQFWCDVLNSNVVYSDAAIAGHSNAGNWSGWRYKTQFNSDTEMHGVVRWWLFRSHLGL